MDYTLIIMVIGSVFLGSLMRATFGFGDSVVSMPLLALLPIPFSVSVSLIGLTGMTTALMSIQRGWKDKDPVVIKKLTLATIIGIPVGLFLVRFAEQSVINLILGSVLVIYSLYSLTASPARREYLQAKFENPNYSYPFGFLGGMLGSAYNMNGIPVVLYAAARDWTPRQFLGTVQSHFLISSVFVISGHALSGFWNWDVAIYFAFSVPVVALAMYIGRKIYNKIDTDKFRTYIFIMILILGAVNIGNFIQAI